MNAEVGAAHARQQDTAVEPAVSNRQGREALFMGAIIGALIFWWFTGGSILDPLNLDWIMSSRGDPVQHYTGWQFFRHEEFFQWPFGFNAAYGEAMASSVVFTDSLPLFAFLFKPLNSLLTPDFQYFGIWVLCCFILQAVFAWKIVAMLTPDRVLIALGTCFFVLSPPMLWRLNGHEALVGHWLILAALYTFLAVRRKGIAWTLLLSLAAMVHVYLLAMVASLWLADAIRSIVYKKEPPVRVVCRTLIATAILVFVMWGTGYFYHNGGPASGYEWFRWNLLSFFNPLDVWSVFFSGSIKDGDYEGFSYIGAGMLGLVLLTIGAWLVYRRRIPVRSDIVVPLGVLSAGLVVYALSNNVTLGSHTLFTYSVPEFLQPLTSTFRASGRFIWPVFYLLQLAVLIVLFRNITARPAKFLLSAMLILQIVDLSQASSSFKTRWSETGSGVLASSFWQQVPDQYRRVAFAVPTTEMAPYGPIALVAARNQMSVNGGMLARLDTNVLAAVEDSISDEIVKGDFRQDSLYIFTKDYLFQHAILNAGESDFVGWADGHPVLAPSWKGCIESCGLGRASPRPLGSGTSVDFSIYGTADQHLSHGWSGAEGTGRWTEQNKASLTVWLGQQDSAVEVTFKLRPLVNQSHPTQRLGVSVNGKAVAEWALSDPTEKDLSFTIDPALLRDAKGFATIVFDLPDAVAPKQIGMGRDPRELGVFVSSMSVSY